MMWYVFKMYKGNKFFYTRFYSGSVEDAAVKADEWCEMHGCTDWELAGSEWA